MATNLRLRPEAEAALRAEAERTGRSQQDLLREAVDVFLGVQSGGVGPAGLVPVLSGEPAHRPRQPYRKVRPSIRLAAGVRSLDLLGREDRF